MKILFLTGIVIVLACGGAWASLNRSPVPDATVSLPARDTYVTQVRLLDQWVDDLTARTVRDPKSWLAWESLANTYKQRGQFTGSYIDYQRALVAMDQSFVVAGHGVGPFVSRAQLNGSLHRYPLIDADLTAASDAGLVDDLENAAIHELRASCAFYGGRYPEAVSEYRSAVSLDRSPVNLFALADALISLGQGAEAEPLLREAERLARTSDVVTRAWLATQLGVIALAHGHWDEAGARYQQAATILPGWWMIESRIAELDALRGDHQRAIVAYQALVKRTGKPELMDALSKWLRAEGQEAEASHWTEVSRAAYASLLSEHPEAAYGHALDHYLDLETDSSLAVDLAERNQRLRPGGDATTKLARAYVKAGRLVDARITIDHLLATQWETAEAHATAAAVFSACGDTDRAQEQHALALAINPHS